MVGVIDDVKKCITSYFKNYLNLIIVIGKDRFEIGASEYLNTCHNLVKGDAPTLDIEGERKLIDFMVEAAKLSLIQSAHDISEGGLAVALSEMTFENEIGCELEFDENVRNDLLLFSESQGRMIVEVKRDDIDKVVNLLKRHSLTYNIAGKTIGNAIVVKNRGRKILNVNVLAAKYVYENAIAGKMS
jgi:phosphoribosylformylglycinamidine synthase